ncbi:MAG: ATP-dependent helicase [Treponema sp.]|nr:ATP-dependent helicase [Treponema sp.]
MRMAGDPSYLEPLNKEQRRAVLHTGKPLLILAGAGSGKTRVIKTKIAWLIREQGIDPRSILAVTFTNKAANEMAHRARKIDERAGNAMLRTFHSFGAWFLRRNGHLAGLDSGFVIYDDTDVVALLSSIMENTPKPEVKYFAHCIARAKDYFLSPDDSELALINHQKKFRDIYKQYEERMAQIGNVDFGDLIKKPAEILRSQPEVAKRFHDRFAVIMVDEYQDANVAQFHLLKELCSVSTYVCVVGDDDQSIYRFRGAEVKNILDFPNSFAGADIIRLEQNYRSTSPILQAASSVVNRNRDRLGKVLNAEKGDGPFPELTTHIDQYAEAEFCADKIEQSVKNKTTTWADWAILYRTNAQSAVFETLFLRRRIPYRVVGSFKFYEREEIKDALALLSFLANPRDEVAFRRVVNKPTRGVGPVTVHNIIQASITGSSNLAETSLTLQCSQKARAGLKEFINVIDNAKVLLGDHEDNTKDYTNNKYVKDVDVKRKRKKLELNGAIKKQELKPGKGLSICVHNLLINSGVAEYHAMEDEISGNSKIGNLQELLNAAIDYPNNREGLLNFLENIELDRNMKEETQNPQDTVTLITFHNTKGLEFKRVFMTGLEQGIFPREEKKDEELEEERRLFYVGATRAMEELYLTKCEQRTLYGKTMPMTPSLFLNEIDKSVINEIKKKNDFAFGITERGGWQSFGKPSSSGKGKDQDDYLWENKSFNPFQLTSAMKELEEVSGWRIGQRLFHENHGYGGVLKIKDSDDGPIVYVKFDNGQEKSFLSEYQSKAYEKIGDDW